MTMRALCVLIFLAVALGPKIFAVNELQRMEFSPRYSVLNSSAFADDSPALYVNPACLFRVDRFNLALSTSTFQTISFLGVSGMVPVIGGAFGFSYYNLDGMSKRGISLGWGRDIMGWLSLGFSVKTVSGAAVEFNDGLYADLGLVLFPNDTTGIDLFRNRALNNRIFLSFAVQNLGKPAERSPGEELSLRLGLGYDIWPIWTKIFVDRFFLTTSDRFILGAEFHPENTVWKFLSLRLSWDFQDLRIGGAFSGDDFRADVSYNATRPALQFSFTGYFEQDRSEISRRDYEDGMTLYNRAQRMESRGDDRAYLVYHDAYQKFQSALNYDKYNRKAELRKSQIEDKISDYQNAYLARARAAEDKNDPVTALQYYNMANQVQETAPVRDKIMTLATNADVLAYSRDRKAEIRSLIRARKYLSAKQRVTKLELVVPFDGEVGYLRRDVDSRLGQIAQRYFYKAQDLYGRDLFEDSIAQARLALRYDPEMDRAYDLIDLANAELGARRGLEKAQEQYRKKNYLGALKMANWILAKTPNNREAQDLKNRVLRIFRDNAKTYLSNGIGYFNSSEYDRAIEEFDKVLLVDTNNTTAQEYRSRAQTKMKAIETLEGIEDE